MLYFSSSDILVLRFLLFVFVHPICSWSGLSLVTRWPTNKTPKKQEFHSLWLELNIEDENFHQVPRNGWKYVSANLWKISFNFRPSWLYTTFDSGVLLQETFMFSFIQILWRVVLHHMIMFWYIIYVTTIFIWIRCICIRMFSMTIWTVGELWRPSLLQKQPIPFLLELRLLPHGDKSILKVWRWQC